MMRTIEAATETSYCSLEGPGSGDDTVTGELAVGVKSAIGDIATDASHLVSWRLSSSRLWLALAFFSSISSLLPSWVP